MARYHFVTIIELPRSREQVWQVLQDTSGWASWWRWLERVELLGRGEANGVGARHRYTFRTGLLHSLTFETEVVRVQRPSHIEARAAGERRGWAVGSCSTATSGLGWSARGSCRPRRRG